MERALCDHVPQDRVCVIEGRDSISHLYGSVIKMYAKYSIKFNDPKNIRYDLKDFADNFYKVMPEIAK
jgi:hypothetical protein